MTPDEFRRYLADVAWFWPGVAISVVVSTLLSSRVARVLRIGRFLASVLMMTVGLVASATLTPSLEALRFGAVGTGTCDLSRIGPASLDELSRFGDPTFNVLLFIPLGVAIGLFPWSRRKAVLLGIAIALPFVIETIQLTATGLDRACQSADIADNLTGFLVGFALGTAIVGLGRLISRAIADDHEAKP